ncbi:hypothetical protein FKM82_022019 [Ascaphus truei]
MRMVRQRTCCTHPHGRLACRRRMQVTTPRSPADFFQRRGTWPKWVWGARPLSPWRWVEEGGLWVQEERDRVGHLLCTHRHTFLPSRLPPVAPLLPSSLADSYTM